MWLPSVEVTSSIAGMKDVLNMKIHGSVYGFVSFFVFAIPFILNWIYTILLVLSYLSQLYLPIQVLFLHSHQVLFRVGGAFVVLHLVAFGFSSSLDYQAYIM